MNPCAMRLLSYNPFHDSFSGSSLINLGVQGQAGSDVAKDASDIILTDDNFASILNAVEEGRRLFDNIKRFVLHVLAENIAQATTLLVGLAFKDASGNSVFPLAPVQILWVIMVRDRLTR